MAYSGIGEFIQPGLSGLNEPAIVLNGLGQDPGEGFEIVNIPEGEKALFKQLLMAASLGILAGLMLASLMRHGE